MRFLARKGVILVAVLTLILFSVQTLSLTFLLNKWMKNVYTQNEIKKQYTFLDAENWKKFSSSNGKFSILFPANPATTNLIIHVSTASAEAHVYYVNANVQNTFAIAYVDNTNIADWTAGTNGEYYLQKIQSSAISQQPAKVVYQQESTFEGYPAREFEYAAGGKANYSVRYKMILVHQRLYYLYVVFLTANPYPRLRTIFFNSFSLD